MSKKR